MARKPQGLAVMRAGKAGEREEGLTDIGLKSSKIVTQMRHAHTTGARSNGLGKYGLWARVEQLVLMSIR